MVVIDVGRFIYKAGKNNKIFISCLDSNNTCVLFIVTLKSVVNSFILQFN